MPKDFFKECYLIIWFEIDWTVSEKTKRKVYDKQQSSLEPTKFLFITLSSLRLCIGQVFWIRYNTIRLVAISDILYEQFV